MTIQLATRVSPKVKLILEKLHKKTKIPICQLTEKAILLLDSHYKKMQDTHGESSTHDRFAELLEGSMKQYSKTYKTLAK